MRDAIEDTRIVEAANFTHTVKFAAHTVVASLRYLKELSHELRISMADLQPAHVIENLKSEDQKQRAHQAEVARSIDAYDNSTLQKPNKAPEPTTMAVTPRAPSSTSRASHGRGSS